MVTYPFDAVCVSDRAYISSVNDGQLRDPQQEERFIGSLTIGKVYQVLGERLGMFIIVDDTGESYLYPKSRFRIV